MGLTFQLFCFPSHGRLWRFDHLKSSKIIKHVKGQLIGSREKLTAKSHISLENHGKSMVSGQDFPLSQPIEWGPVMFSNHLGGPGARGPGPSTELD